MRVNVHDKMSIGRNKTSATELAAVEELSHERGDLQGASPVPVYRHMTGTRHDDLKNQQNINVVILCPGGGVPSSKQPLSSGSFQGGVALEPHIT